MGFDKPDLPFIIHYQRPSSVIHYYQQVGRAGRGITDAYGFLMWGEEDERIADYFVANAFTIVHSCKMSTLVIDDVISSGMTFTTVAALLRYDGCPKVVPAALVYRSLSE